MYIGVVNNTEMEDRILEYQKNGGDPSAILADNVPLLKFAMKKYAPNQYVLDKVGLEWEELEHLCHIAMWNCLDSFDRSKAKWITFAVKAMYHEIFNTLRRYKAKKRYAGGNLSIYQILDGMEGGVTISDLLQDGNDYISEGMNSVFLQEELPKLKSALTDKQLKVVEAYVANPYITQVELAKTLGLNQPNINRIFIQVRKIYQKMGEAV